MRLLFFYLLSLIGTLGYSQSHIWTGNGGDTDWFNPANWNINEVPNSDSTVLIGGTAVVSVANSPALFDYLQLEETAMLIQDADITTIGGILIQPFASYTFVSGTYSGGILSNSGELIFTGFDDKALSACELKNKGMVSIFESGTIDLINNALINNHAGAEIKIESPGGLIQDAGGATVNNDGTIVKINQGAPGAFYMIFDMNNQGVIEVQEDQTFLFLTAGATFHNYPYGKLSGNGVFDITANFINEGTVIPGGDEVGTLEVLNNFSMAPEGVLEVNINGINSEEYDVLEVFGSPELAGSITVNPQLTADDILAEFPVLTSNFTIESCDILGHAEGTDGVDTFLFDVFCNPNDVTLQLIGILLGTEDFEQNISWGLFPNPGKDIITFEIADFSQIISPIQLGIFNTLGQRIHFEDIMPQKSWELDISNLSNGVYFIEMKSTGVSFRTQKLVKI